MRAYGSRLALLLLLPPPGSGERQQARFAYYSEALPLQARGPRLCEPLAHLDLEPPCRLRSAVQVACSRRWFDTFEIRVRAAVTPIAAPASRCVHPAARCE